MPYTPENNPYIPGDPYSYDLKWIVEQIKKFLPLVKSFEELKKYVDDYFANLDLSQEVSDKIDEMLADGSLEEILKKLFYARQLHIARYGRFLDRFTILGRTQSLYAQSICYDGSSRYFIAGSWNSNAIQTITVWNNDGVFIDSATYTEIGHANSCAYWDGKIYVTNSSTQVAVIDADSLAFEGYITGFSALGFGSCRGIGIEKGIAYVVGATDGIGGFGIIAVDLASNTLTKKAWDMHIINTVWQGSTVYDGYLYSMYNRDNQIAKWNIETGELEQIFGFPDSDQYWYVGEPEDIMVKDGQMYILGWNYAPDFETNNYNASIAQLFETDMLKPTMIHTGWNYRQPWEPLNVTIDEASDYRFNPSETFQCAEEVNALVPALSINVVDCTTGYIFRQGGHLTLYATSTNRTLERVRVINGEFNLNNLIINNMVVYNSQGHLVKCTVNDLDIRRTLLDSVGSKICLSYMAYTTLRNNIASYTSWSDDTQFTHVETCCIEQIWQRPTTANVSSYFIPNLKANIAPFDASTWFTIKFDVYFSGSNTVYPLELAVQKSDITNGFTRICNDVTVTLSGNTFSFTIGGNSVSPTRYMNLGFLILH